MYYRYEQNNKIVYLFMANLISSVFFLYFINTFGLRF